MNNVVIASLARTPIAKFCGSFQGLTAPQLGAEAIKGALAALPPDTIVMSSSSAAAATSSSSSASAMRIREAYLGNVVSAGVGQAPARQAVRGAGLPNSVICTTVNKVCASGMKAAMLATQTLQCAGSTKPGFAMLAGGMESMSKVPHYLPGSRSGTTLGHAKFLDGLIHDGLWDVYNDQHMGMCGEKCATDYGISRQDQDEYAAESYRRAQAAVEAKVFREVIPVAVPQKRGSSKITIIDRDEEPGGVTNVDKFGTLRPAFDKNNGTITAANASSLNDGAAAMILLTEQDALDRGITPLARILGYGDAEQDPVDFTTAPSLAVPVALRQAGLEASDIEYHEINEAFSVVALANMNLLGLQHDRVNVFGGAVSLGHPLGMSGARIMGTLIDVLREKDATIGCASICNGGGGASAIVLERMS